MTEDNKKPEAEATSQSPGSVDEEALEAASEGSSSSEEGESTEDAASTEAIVKTGADPTSEASGGGLFDFRRPAKLPPRLKHHLTQWLERIRALSPVKLGPHVPDLTVQIQPHETHMPDAAEPPQPMVAFRISVNQQIETILAVHRPLALTIVAAMLGETTEAIRDDRALTLVEQSVFDLVVRDFVDVLDEAGQPLDIRCQFLGSERRTQLIRLFPPGKPIALLNFQWTGGFGAGSLAWIWSQDALESLFSAEEPPTPAPHLPQIAQRLPFELAVRLGHASVSVQRLAKLKPGDVIVLDQSVTEPLVAEVGGIEKMHVWPGRDGTRQAIRVDGLIDDD